MKVKYASTRNKQQTKTKIKCGQNECIFQIK